MNERISILGGTGPEGRGLARRFAEAGHSVVLGSRESARADAAAAEINAELRTNLASGDTNQGAAGSGDVVVLAIPYAGLAETIEPLAQTLAGRLVVSTVVPLEFSGGGPRVIRVDAGSAAEQLQQLIPKARVVAAFHHLSAPSLSDLRRPIAGDVLVCGDDSDARRMVIALADELPGVQGIDAGPLLSAGQLEAFTAVLLRINRRYKARAGIRITGVPAAPRAETVGA
jgi:8-hydroxy-5-deazaflavin:NADPH oxidoreductase